MGFLYFSSNKAEVTYEQLTFKTYADHVKHMIHTYKKPARAEIEIFTKRYQNEIAEIRKIKILTDKNATFYMQIQLFSDDEDPTAPLIVQIKFKDIKTNSLIKEESINLE